MQVQPFGVHYDLHVTVRPLVRHSNPVAAAAGGVLSGLRGKPACNPAAGSKVALVAFAHFWHRDSQPG